MNGQSKESLKTYRKAFNIDETSVAALAGIIYCQITEQQIGEAEQQLEFLNEACSYCDADLQYIVVFVCTYLGVISSVMFMGCILLV